MRKLFLLLLALLMIIPSITMASILSEGWQDASLDELESAISEIYSHISELRSSSIPSEFEDFTEYLYYNNITLESWDVQYDYANSIDQMFSIEGSAELSTYYNYGFGKDLEKDYFCLEVSPYDGGYTDRWYVYCRRDSFEDVFKLAKEDGHIFVEMVCIVPSDNYNEGQNQMAMLEFMYSYY